MPVDHDEEPHKLFSEHAALFTRSSVIFPTRQPKHLYLLLELLGLVLPYCITHSEIIRVFAIPRRQVLFSRVFLFFSNRTFRLVNANNYKDTVESISEEWTLQWKRHGFSYAEAGYRLRSLDLASVDLLANEKQANKISKKNYQQYVKKHKYFTGKSRFVSKAPINSLRVGYLNSLFPNAYFINIVRDGRAVASSIMEKVEKFDDTKWGPQPELLPEPETFDLIIRRCGLQWKLIVERIEEDFQKSVHADQRLTIKYEEFVQDSVEALNQICTFCGLKPSLIDWHKLAKRISTGRNEKWRHQLSEEEKQALESSIEEKLNTLRY